VIILIILSLSLATSSMRRHFLLSLPLFFFLMLLPPPRSTLFPYTRSSDLIHSNSQGGTARGGSQTLLPRAECKVVRRTVGRATRSEEHTSELQSRRDLVCRRLLEKKHDTDTIGEQAEYKRRQGHRAHHDGM